MSFDNLASVHTEGGILFAYFGTSVLVRIMASGRAFEHIEIHVQPDLHLLLFTAEIALLTGFLFGLAPAWHAFWSAPASALRQSGSRRYMVLEHVWQRLGDGAGGPIDFLGFVGCHLFELSVAITQFRSWFSQ